MNEALKATIESSLREAASHIDKLHRSAAYLGEIRPITAAHLETGDPQLVLNLDQFVYRFSKLQDSMAWRLLPSLFALLESDPEPRTFLDVLGRLEELGVVTSVAAWQRLRNLRNTLAHDANRRTQS